MPLFDLPIDALRTYRPELPEPDDFDSFWERTLNTAATHPLSPRYSPTTTPLTMVDVYDVQYGGWNGDPINAWLLTPRDATGVGCVVQYIGYRGGRGFPHQHLTWPAAGWAALIVDTRGQGASSTTLAGDTADPTGATGPHAPGMMTHGIEHPDGYYYRRVFTDAVRAVDVAKQHPTIDETRVVVAGGSQGGGMAQAVAGLRDDLLAAFIDVPFLTHFRRACEIASKGPYPEIVEYLSARRGEEDNVFHTLSYFDGLNFAARGKTPAHYSVALMDTICPPSTVFGAYNHHPGPKDIDVWPWNEHEGGEAFQVERQLDYLSRL